MTFFFSGTVWSTRPEGHQMFPNNNGFCPDLSHCHLYTFFFRQPYAPICYKTYSDNYVSCHGLWIKNMIDKTNRHETYTNAKRHNKQQLTFQFVPNLPINANPKSKGNNSQWLAITCAHGLKTKLRQESNVRRCGEGIPFQQIGGHKTFETVGLPLAAGGILFAASLLRLET